MYSIKMFNGTLIFDLGITANREGRNFIFISYIANVIIKLEINLFISECLLLMYFTLLKSFIKKVQFCAHTK